MKSPLEKLKELTEKLIDEDCDIKHVVTAYEQIKKDMYQELVTSDLSVVTILRDLKDIKARNEKWAHVIELAITELDLSYSDIGKRCGISKQWAYDIIVKLGKEYHWIDEIRSVRSHVRKDKKGVSKRAKIIYTDESL